MKAVVDIGYRSVRITYSVKEILVDYDKRQEFHAYEITQKNAKAPIICSHTINFDSTDEWQSVQLFDGRWIDFHYDYVNSKIFDNKKDWGHYMFQGYEYIDGEPQLYLKNEVKQVKIKF
jgi:hypothetical protein